MLSHTLAVNTELWVGNGAVEVGIGGESLISKCALSLSDKLDQHPRPRLMESLSDNKGFSGQGQGSKW